MRTSCPTHRARLTDDTRFRRGTLPDAVTPALLTAAYESELAVPALLPAIDYALRPVLSSMGAAHIVPGWFTLDKDITTDADGRLTVAPASAEALAEVTDRFSAALHGRPTHLAAAG